MSSMYLELHEKLSQLQWLMHRYQLKNHDGRGPRRSPVRGQGRVLAMLKIQPEISTKDLAYLLGIRQQSLNELLTKLEKEAFITRTPSEEDKRVMIIKLTEKGAQEKLEDPEDTIFNCLSVEEQQTFSEYLDRLIASLEKEVGNQGADFEKRMEHMRHKMGEEKFEQFMSMKGHPRHRKHRGRHPFFDGEEPRGPESMDDFEESFE